MGSEGKSRDENLTPEKRARVQEVEAVVAAVDEDPDEALVVDVDIVWEDRVPEVDSRRSGEGKDVFAVPAADLDHFLAMIHGRIDALRASSPRHPSAGNGAG